MPTRSAYGTVIQSTVATRRGVLAATAWLMLGMGACAVFAPAARAHTDIEEQVARMTGLIAQRPEEARLYLQRAELHRLHRDWDEARTDYTRAERLDPELDAVLLGLAKLELESGDPGAAVRRIDRLLTLRHDATDGWIVRARAHGALGRTLLAAADYDRAISMILAGGRVPSPEIYLERSRVLQASGEGQFGRALTGLEEGRIHLGGPIVLEIEAIGLERRLGKTDAALSRIDRLSSGSSRQESWLILRGEVLEGAGRGEEAREAYLAALTELEGRPAHRRGVRALRALESEIHAALNRLGDADPVDRDEGAAP